MFLPKTLAAAFLLSQSHRFVVEAFSFLLADSSGVHPPTLHGEFSTLAKKLKESPMACASPESAKGTLFPGLWSDSCWDDDLITEFERVFEMRRLKRS